MKKNLIVYFSRCREIYAHGKIVDLKKVNTEIIAEMIHS